jgi:SAM-dependent methyltransferase
VDRLLELTNLVEARHFWFRGFRGFMRPLVARATAGKPTPRILDAGCGTGFNLRWLARYGRPTGMDLTFSGLQVARRAGRSVVRGDAMRLPYATAAFDVVTLFDLLACLPDDRMALAEMARVLKPGGYLVANIAALDILYGDHSALSADLRRYTPSRLRAHLAAVGLTPVSIRFGFLSTLPLLLMVRLVQKLRRGAATPQEAEITMPPALVNVVLSAVVMLEVFVSRVIPMPIGSSLRVLAHKPMA